MTLEQQFQQAADRSKSMTRRPPNEELLELYGLFKQGSEGDVTGERPAGFDFKGMAKFDAWASRKGMSKEEAMQQYVALVDRLIQQYS
jgi:acyl-CoA-binding protein